MLYLVPRCESVLKFFYPAAQDIPSALQGSLKAFPVSIKKRAVCQPQIFIFDHVALHFIRFKNIVRRIKGGGCQYQQHGIRCKMMHGMPVFRFQDKALIRVIQDIIFFFLPVVIGYHTASMKADSSLYGGFMTMSSPRGIIHAVNIKNAFYLKRDLFFNNGKVSSFIAAGGKVDNICHGVNTGLKNLPACKYDTLFLFFAAC